MDFKCWRKEKAKGSRDVMFEADVQCEYYAVNLEYGD